MPCSAACAAVRFLITVPSARSTRIPTSFSGSEGPRSFAFVSLARSITTSSGFAPEPSIWTLQRMHGPSSGIPRRFSRGGNGTGLSVSARPWR